MEDKAPLTLGPIVQIPLLSFLNNFQYSVEYDELLEVDKISTYQPSQFTTSTLFSSTGLDIPTITLQLKSTSPQSGQINDRKNTSTPISTFYLQYNSQTTYYDFLGTDQDDIENYDASFTYDAFTTTSDNSNGYQWNFISGNYYGVGLHLDNWHSKKPKPHHQTHHHNAVGDKEVKEENMKQGAIEHEAKKE